MKKITLPLTDNIIDSLQAGEGVLLSGTILTGRDCAHKRICEFLKPGTGKAAIVLPDGILTNSSSQYVRDFILERFQLLAVVSLPQCAFAHFGAGVKASVIFVRKRDNNEVVNNKEAIFMAAPKLIGYDATGRKTESQLDEIVEQYKKFQEDPTPFFV